jgi:hypothetical protein
MKNPQLMCTGNWITFFKEQYNWTVRKSDIFDFGSEGNRVVVGVNDKDRTTVTFTFTSVDYSEQFYRQLLIEMEDTEPCGGTHLYDEWHDTFFEYVQGEENNSD